MAFVLRDSAKPMDITPAIVLTDESDEGASPALPTRTVERWKCDICCVQTFPTREECISHEEICGASESQKEKPKLHPFFQTTMKRKQPPPPEAQKRFKKAKASKATENQEIIVVDDVVNISDPATKSTPFPHNASSTESGSTSNNSDLLELAAALGVSPDALLAEQQALERQADRAKQQISDIPKPSFDCKAPASGSTVKRSKAPARSSPSADTKPMTEITNNELNALAAALGVSPASLLAEQQALELKTHCEKNQALHKSSQKEPALSKSTATMLNAMKRRKESAIRFPSHSHVKSRVEDIIEDKEPSKGWHTSDHRQDMKSRWSSHSQSNETANNCNFEPIPLLNGMKIQWEPKTETVDQKLFDLLSRNLIVLPNRLRSPELWVDCFRMKDVPNDLCGNKHQFAELKSFLKDWREVRQKCLKHMASKYVQKKTLKVTTNHNVDDDWMDSDAGEDLGLPSICVVSGAVGCGKSDLIRALVESNDCRLYELSTVEKRGATALKRAIGEATQSLSSSDLMRKSKKNCIFGINTDADIKDENVSSLTAILLDEVVILFENNGDGGFWQALLDLSKKAKSPIFLTTNAIETPSFYCEYVQMKRPRPEECTLHLRRCIEKISAFRFVSGIEADQDEFLEEIVRLCGGDLRKVAHEMQAYSYSTPSGPHVLGLSNDDLGPVVTKLPSCDEQDSMNHLIVDYVHPSRFDTEQYNLLEVTGSGFLSLIEAFRDKDKDSKRGIPVTVFVGDRKCPDARILNDSTILAVCPPFIPDRRDPKKSISYEPIQICSTRLSGITSTSIGRSFALPLPDGSTILTGQLPINIQRHVKFKSSAHSVPTASRLESCGSQSDEEHAFEDEVRSSTCTDVVCGNNPLDHERISQIINDGIDAWLSRHTEGPKFDSRPTNTMSASSDISELWQLCVDTDLASDAAFLEDIGLNGTPYLAGPVLGFGFNLTEAYPLSNNESQKRPTENTLFQTGWKDDCGFYGSSDTFMTIPLTRRERQLLQRAEKLERGLALPELSGKIDQEEDIENGTALAVHVSAEDSFLPNPAPQSILSLPNDLRDSRSRKDKTYASSGTRDEMFEKAKLFRDSVIQTLQSTVFAIETWPPLLFFSVLHRTLHPLLPESLQIDQSFYLDYYPILRYIAVFDRAAERAFKKGLEVEMSHHLSKKRANTRRATRKGFSHFWEAIVPRELWKNDDEYDNGLPVLQHLTNTLADHAMYSISSIPDQS